MKVQYEREGGGRGGHRKGTIVTYHLRDLQIREEDGRTQRGASGHSSPRGGSSSEGDEGVRKGILTGDWIDTDRDTEEGEGKALAPRGE